jgi:hypothetical protein
VKQHLTVGIAALTTTGIAACAGIASASASVTAYDQSTTNALAVGSTFHGVSSDSAITGSFFGAPVTVSCAMLSTFGSEFEAKVSSNDGTTATAKVTKLDWHNCTNAVPNACTVVTQNLPWDPAATTPGGIDATSTTSVTAGMGSTGDVQISGASCLPFGSTCTFKGSGTTPLSNSVTGTWRNTAPQWTVNPAANNTTSSICGGAKWSATFKVKTGPEPAGGADSGDLVGLRTP